MKRLRPWRLQVFAEDTWIPWSSYAAFETACDKLLALEQWNGAFGGSRRTYRILHHPTGEVHLTNEIF